MLNILTKTPLVHDNTFDVKMGVGSDREWVIEILGTIFTARFSYDTQTE